MERNLTKTEQKILEIVKSIAGGVLVAPIDVQNVYGSTTSNVSIHMKNLKEKGYLYAYKIEGKTRFSLTGSSERELLRLRLLAN